MPGTQQQVVASERQKRSGISKPPARKRQPHNRYYRNAKLSEHQFLRILKAFADNDTAAEAASGMRVTLKSVRAVYAQLRACLLPATVTWPHRFGAAGFFLYRDGRLSERGRHFLEVIALSDLYREHVSRHGFRLRKPSDRQHIAFEVTVRVFCNIAMPTTPEVLYDQETRTALQQIQNIAAWIEENRETEGFLEKYASIITRFGKVLDAIPTLIAKEELLSLRDKSVQHRYPGNLLYDHLRRYLRQYPL